MNRHVKMGRQAAGMSALPREGALILAFVAVLIFSFLSPVMNYSELPMTGEGSPVRQIAYLVALAIAIVGVRPIVDPRRLAVVPLALLVALAWCWISLSWSDAVGVGLRRLVLTCAIIWTLFLTVQHLGYARTIAVLRVALVIVLVANFVAVFLFPDFGIHQIAEPGDKRLIGDWRGIMMHKNFAGAISAITLLTFLLDARKIPMAVRVVVVAAAAVFLGFTASKTSFGLVGVSLLLGILFQRYSSRYRVPVIVGLTLLGLIAAILFNLLRNPLKMQFEDADSFTGRTQIWKALADYMHDNGLLGAGYGSFWNVGPNAPIYHYASNWVSQISSGHNGFMDLLVTIGLPGVVLALIAAFLVPFAELLRAKGIPLTRGGLLLALLIFCIGHNSTESSLLDRDTIIEVILMITIALIQVSRGDSDSEEWRPDVPIRRARGGAPAR